MSTAIEPTIPSPKPAPLESTHTDMNVTSNATEPEPEPEPEPELDDDILQDMDESQLDEYKQMLRCLGTHPDKVLINTLSMIAEDYAVQSQGQGANGNENANHLNSNIYSKSCAAIYNAIRDLLLSPDIKPECKLPLVYVMDSILKNVRGYFVQLMKEDFFPSQNTNSNDGGENTTETETAASNSNWMTEVYNTLSRYDHQHDHPHTIDRSRLRRVWNTWNPPGSGANTKFQIFPLEQWKMIGKCFLDEDEKIQQSKLKADAMTRAAGIERDSTDGSLKLSMALRKQMEIVLDEMQDNQVDELEKVSLERLADIDPNLLVEIKKAAEMILLEKKNQTGSLGGMGSSTDASRVAHAGDGKGTNDEDSYFVEMRSEDVVQRCREWDKLQLNHLEGTNDTIRKLFSHIRTCTATSLAVLPIESTCPSDGASGSSSEVDMTKILGAASATASTLTHLLERYKQQDTNKGSIPFTAVPGGGESSTSSNLLLSISNQASNMYGNNMLSQRVDPSKFTSEGLKEKNDSVIARLYDGGLPFVCSSDGRRFATQLELSNHLDKLFKRGQLEKSMERNEERGWYVSDHKWSRRRMGLLEGSSVMSAGNVDSDLYMDVDEDMLATSGENAIAANAANNNIMDPQSAMVTADETRDRCIICGINFTMHFDQEEGEWKYSNCREVKVLNDDAAERDSELMLVHVTCHRGLGSPEVLSQDQVLQLY